MWIFIVLIFFLVVLSIYYLYRHFKSNKPDRIFVVDDKGTTYLNDEKIVKQGVKYRKKKINHIKIHRLCHN